MEAWKGDGAKKGEIEEEEGTWIAAYTLAHRLTESFTGLGRISNITNAFSSSLSSKQTTTLGTACQETTISFC